MSVAIGDLSSDGSPHDYSNGQDEDPKIANFIYDERRESEDGICDGKNTPNRRWVNGNYAHGKLNFIAVGKETVEISRFHSSSV